jgi:hypothetical protein
MLALINYTSGSLVYHELIIAPAIIRAAGRIGAWISHIYVDDQASLAAGHDIWGLPKQLASFEWQTDEQRIRVQGRDLDVEFMCETNSQGMTLPIPLLAPAFAVNERAVNWLLATGSGRLRAVRGQISCMAPDIDGLVFDVCSRFYRLQRFQLRLPAPRGWMLP